MTTDVGGYPNPDLNGPRYNLSVFIAVVKEELKKFPEFRKRLSGHNQDSFATDLALVAYRLRTGCLVDLFSPNDSVDLFSRLLGVLRANDKTKDYFMSVLHLYEPSSDQSFFVNTALLAPRIKAFHSSGDGPAGSHGQPTPLFISLRSPIEIRNGAPGYVLQLLTSLLPLTTIAEPPLSFSLPNDTPFETAVPLAAVLLDYLVAYVPSSSHSNVLSGTPLNFYECLLTFPSSADGNWSANSSEDRENTHSVMKFSCPVESGEDRTTGSQLHPERMVRVLEDTFTERLERIGDSTMRIRIEHSTQTLDHVAF